MGTRPSEIGRSTLARAPTTLGAGDIHSNNCAFWGERAITTTGATTSHKCIHKSTPICALPEPSRAIDQYTLALATGRVFLASYCRHKDAKAIGGNGKEKREAEL